MPAFPLPGIRLGLCRGVGYGLLDRAEPIMPAIRSLGARLVRVNLYWSQIEPEPGRFTWDTVDTLLEQLDGDEEVWVTVCSSSPWATRHTTRFLPSSPAVELADYRRFVRALVRRCRGAVRYWQCENEPCVPLLWAGEAEEYLSQLAVFAAEVRSEAPDTLVVLGGAVPTAIFAEESGGNERWAEYLARIVREGDGLFDLFDLHPYGDPYAIPALVRACENFMATHGTVKPIVVGEHNGPMPTAFPENRPHLAEVVTEYRSTFLGHTSLSNGGLDPDRKDLGRESPAMVRLYERMAELPPTLRMFMAGRSTELERELHRILREELVIRTVLLLASGIGRIACYQLAPESREAGSHLHMRSLMFDAFALMDYEGDAIARRRPAAETFAMPARELGDATEVRRRSVPDTPGIHLFEVHRRTRGPLHVAWRRDKGTAPITSRSSGPITAFDALGENVPVSRQGNDFRIPVSATPVFFGGEVGR